MDRLDLCSIGKLSAIPNMDAILSNIDIFHKKGQRLPHAHRRFVQETHQKAIAHIGTRIEEFLDLVLRDGFRMLSLLFFLSQDVFGNGRPLGDVVKKRLVPTHTRRQEGGGLVPHIGRDCFHTPVIVVKASHDREGMVDRAVRASLWNGLGWEHLEGTGGELEPENETCQVIEGDLLPVEPLLSQILPVVLERSGIGAKRITGGTSSIKVLQIAYNRLDHDSLFIDHDIASLILTRLHLNHTHTLEPHSVQKDHRIEQMYHHYSYTRVHITCQGRMKFVTRIYLLYYAVGVGRGSR